MNTNEINDITKKWTDTVIYYFKDFDNETHSQRLHAYVNQKPLEKFTTAGLIEQTKERDYWKLTAKGLDLLESLKKILDSGRIYPLSLPIRQYYANLTLRNIGYDLQRGNITRDEELFNGLRETVLKDKSRAVRNQVAEFLSKNHLLDRATANKLAQDKEPTLRSIAAKFADKSLYYDETDSQVIAHMIVENLADKNCYEHWIKSPDENIRMLAAGLADETTIEEALGSLSDEDAVQFLFLHPQWAVGKRVERLWARTRGDAHRWLSRVMSDVPDSLIEDALAEDKCWAIKDRLDDYRKALHTVAEFERLFAEGSEIKRKMRARAGLSD